MTAFTSRGSLIATRRFDDLELIVAVVVSSTFMGVLLLWTDEKLEILVRLHAWRNDAAVQEVAHDAVGRRPVVAVAGFVWLQISAAPSVDGQTARREASSGPSSVARSVHHLLREVEHDVALASADEHRAR